MPNDDALSANPTGATRAGLTCDIYRLHTIPNEEISDELLRRAFAISVDGTPRQWRAFVKLIIGELR